MTNWIIGIAIFYGLLTLCLGFVLWRMRIVDEEKQAGSENSFSDAGFAPEQNDLNRELATKQR